LVLDREATDYQADLSLESDADAPHAQVGQGDAEAEASPAPDRGAPFVSNDGRTIRVSATLEPVFELKGFTRIGFRMIRRVIVMDPRGEEELAPPQVAQLPTADLLRIDLATIARGIGRLQSEREKQLSLIVPLSYTSLSTLKGRTELVLALKEAGGLVRLGIICEIGDIDGVPQAALLAATSVVKPVSLLVVGRLTTPIHAVISRLDGGGLQALSFDCPPGLSDAEFQAWATTTLGLSRKVARAALVYRAGSPKRAGLLATLGASHVSLLDGVDP
jgi:hypothetical protein